MAGEKDKGKFEDFLSKYIGEPIAILCMRYWYRGILSKIGDDFIVLNEAKAITETGPASNATPQREDAIPGPLAIKTAVIEIACQPGWAWAGYGQDEKRKKREKEKE